MGTRQEEEKKAHFSWEALDFAPQALRTGGNQFTSREEDEEEATLKNW